MRGSIQDAKMKAIMRCVLLPKSKVPHLNYVADSAIAEGCNLDAGTKIANLRFDDAMVKMSIKGKRIDSGWRK